MAVERGKPEVLNLILTMAGIRASGLNERRLRLCEMVGLSLERLERSVGTVADNVVIRVLRGTALRQVHSATLAMVDVSRAFIMGTVGEAGHRRLRGCVAECLAARQGPDPGRGGHPGLDEKLREACGWGGCGGCSSVR